MAYNEKRMVRIFGFLVFVFSLIPYLMTMAPTVSFWDCGEFIACGATLSVPHPPGAPLYILLNRIATMALSFIQDVSFRITLLSPVSSALTALLVFLSIYRVIRFFIDPEKEATTWAKMIPLAGAFAGALFCAYGFTTWFNAVEAEVYAVANCLIALEFWLGLKWYDYRKSPEGNKILLLITYLAFLGIGFQLYTVIPLPFIFLFVILHDQEKLKQWQLWLIGFSILSVMYSISSFLIIGPVLMLVCLLWVFLNRETAKYVCGFILGAMAVYSLWSAVPSAQDPNFEGLNFILGLVYLALAVLPFLLSRGKRDQELAQWKFCFFLVFFAFIGFSIHFYVPVRSYLDPYVDENNPEVVIHSPGDLFKKETWDKFIYFVERKQYGDESMIVRMVHRRGTFSSQFINHQHMGFGGYLAVQYYNFRDIFSGEIRLGAHPLLRPLKLLAYLLPFLFVLWAMRYTYKRNRPAALYLGLSLIATTVGLILYMNFADGTIPEYREMVRWEQMGRQGPQPPPIQMEVRERDYFWNPGFMLFGLWMGIGFACLLHFLSGRYRDRKPWVLPAVTLLLLASPALPLSMNMTLKSRAGNWVPFDYGYNLLMSCERNGILFTNGDNDTFPLWTLQEAYGIRRDVRVVNLSLLNTDWYIAQLMDVQPKLNIPTVIFDEMFQPRFVAKEAFAKEVTIRRNMLRTPRKVVLSSWKLEITIPDASQTPYFRVQDYMILNIVHGNIADRPVYFAVTVSNDNLMGLAEYLSMEGLVYRVLPQKQSQRLNAERTRYLLDKVYRFTNLGDRRYYLNDEHERLLSNYAACFIGYVYEVRNSLSRARELEKGLQREIDEQKKAKKPDAALISAKETAAKAARAEGDRLFEDIRRELTRCISILPSDWRGRVMSAQMYAMDGKSDLAETALKQGLSLDAEDYMCTVNLGLLLMDSGRQKDGAAYLEKVVYKLDPNFAKSEHRETVNAVSALVNYYRQAKLREPLKALLEKWTAANPQDQRSQQELMQLRSGAF
ncbi:MAG: DUF2723 domain-containing protein [Fibrobacterota bacterium]